MKILLKKKRQKDKANYISAQFSLAGMFSPLRDWANSNSQIWRIFRFPL